MTKKNYTDRLVEIGYTLKEAKTLVAGVKWSMVMLEDTVRCNRKLYDINGGRI